MQHNIHSVYVQKSWKSLCLILLIGLCACQNQPTTPDVGNAVKPAKIITDSSNIPPQERVTLGMYLLYFDLPNGKCTVIPDRRTNAHSDVSGTFSWSVGTIDVDNDTNGVIVPFTIRNNTANTYYDVRLLFSNIFSGGNPPYNMVLENADGYSCYWTADNFDSSEPFIMMNGSGASHTWAPNYSETRNAVFFIPDVNNIPNPYPIRIDGNYGSQQIEPRKATITHSGTLRDNSGSMQFTVNVTPGSGDIVKCCV
jgi:hypothetical protein